MSDLFGNHIVGFPTRPLIYVTIVVSGTNIEAMLSLKIIMALNWTVSDSNERLASTEFEQHRGENQQCGFQTGQTQIRLHSHRRMLDA